MTVHASKGLEFPVVHIAVLAKGLLPARPRPEGCPPPRGMICSDDLMTAEAEEDSFFCCHVPCPRFATFVTSLTNGLVNTTPAGPSTIVLPSRLWLIGLGHLRQAYLWTLGLLPYTKPSEVELVLQDFDQITAANDSTSLLTTAALVEGRKTRTMSAWAEARGFRTRLVERLFPSRIKITDDEPRLALGGVENAQARAAYEDAGFECIIEAGLGAGPTEYLALRLHSFPASTTARAKWGIPTSSVTPALPHVRAYNDLTADEMDECGLVRLASRTVGAPFVGATVATLVIAEVLRLLNGGLMFEVIDMTLRDPPSRGVVPAHHAPRNLNPGSTR